MRQVLDAFGLLARSGPAKNGVVWRLIEAKTNSPPFSVLAEATSLIPNVNIDVAARTQAHSFAYSLKELKAGRASNDWNDADADVIASSLFKRLTHDVKTEVRISGEAPIYLTGDDSLVAANALEYAIPYEVRAKAKSQIGSVDGVILNVTTYYNKPAIVVQEKKSNRKISCVISDAQSEAIGSSSNFSDVWKHRRVVVKGLLLYNSFGDLLRITNASISRRESREVSLDQIKDSSFTNGLSNLEYLGKLRDGEIG